MIESDEQMLVVRRVLRNGRRRYDPASKARLVAACLEPGVSVSRLALDNGINANLLRKWIKEAKEAGPERRPSPSAFVRSWLRIAAYRRNWVPRAVKCVWRGRKRPGLCPLPSR